MEREKEEGNIEYKLMVKPNSKERLEELATQLMYRINEGGGEAFYELGVSNDGQLLGLNEEEARQSFEAMDKICEMIGATYIVIRKGKRKKRRCIRAFGEKKQRCSSYNDELSSTGQCRCWKIHPQGSASYGET
jgi:elongation factor 1-alpha